MARRRRRKAEKADVPLDIGGMAVLVGVGLLLLFAFFYNRQSDGGESSKSVHVKGYYRKDGTYVSPHRRSR